MNLHQANSYGTYWMPAFAGMTDFFPGAYHSTRAPESLITFAHLVTSILM